MKAIPYSLNLVYNTLHIAASRRAG